MELNTTLIDSLRDVLHHILEVQQDVMTLSKDSIVSINKLLSEKGVEIDEGFMKALQSQDIISQQLTATSDAVESIIKTLDIYKKSLSEDTGMVSTNITKLDEKLKKSLEEAKAKKSAFSGHALDGKEEEIEFF